MEKVYIAVMDYCTASIKMYTTELAKGWIETDVENWLHAHTNYNDSQCYYMVNRNEIEVVYEEN